ncbi:MAG: hypothetical protein D3X82_12075 [Candidatus Leucobacter sulfamidivorax]|nr:hypothetical protein [Candidatus Leucobacter sulfamidivorax]
MSADARTGSRRRRLALAAALATLATALFAGVGFSAPASATSVEIAFDFGTVLPGEVRTAEQTFDTPVMAAVADADLIASMPSDLGTFAGEVCTGTADCVAFDALPGRILPAGSHVVRVTLVVADTVSQGARLSSTWRLSLVERTNSLVETGSAAQFGTAAAALLALGAGVLLLAAVSRRRGERS